MRHEIGSFSSEPNLIPYYHEDPENDEYMQSPFPVAVVGLEDENLGIGRVVGAILDDGLPIPIISLDDPKAPEGRVLLSGEECYWACLGDDEEEIIDDLLENHDSIMPPLEYVNKMKGLIESPDFGYCLRHRQLL